jgi:hypothetical protein
VARGPFTVVTDIQAKGTLARDFVGLADDLRDMLTQFGLRTYRVTIVRVRWSGGRRGRGAASVVSEEPILPTPKISSLEALQELAQSVGVDELGAIDLSQISGTYTEDQLRGFRDGDGIPADEEFFYEIEFFPTDSANSGGSKKRRFFPRGAPTYFPGRLQWSVRLEKANEDRNRVNGDPEG